MVVAETWFKSDSRQSLGDVTPNRNFLLYGLPQKLVSKLQRVQNAAARLVTLTSRKAHITPILKVLHWLRISQKIEFKIITTVYRTIHGHAPDYLKDILRHYNPSRALRSKSYNNLEVPRAPELFPSVSLNCGTNCLVF